MKILFDANIWLSFLVEPNFDLPPTLSQLIYRAFASEKIHVLLPEETIAEVERVAATKAYFQARHAAEKWRRLFPLIQEATKIIRVEGKREQISRDPKDDYLLAAMAQYGIDILVTGDNDLLVIGKHGAGYILTVPAAWIVLLEEGLL